MRRFAVISILFFLTVGLSAQSIFDVYRDSTELNAKPPKQDLAVIVNDSPIDELSNPFEVSHIPIRKNQAIKSVTYRDEAKTQLTKKDINTISPLSIILISALILGIILFNYRGILADILQSLMNMNYMSTFMNKSFGVYRLLFLGLYLIFFLNLGLFAVLAYKGLTPGSPSLPLFQIILGISGVYLLRHLFLLVFGWIFELEAEAGTFSFIIALLNISIGLALIPLNLFIAYSPLGLAKALIFTGLLIIALLLMLRYFKGALVSSRRIGTSPFQFFLYFCSFEIAPVLIILYWLGLYG